MNSTLSKVYDTSKKKNNILLELDTVQYNRLKQHAIHLSQIRYDVANNLIFYDRIRYGNSVSTTKQHRRYSGNKKSRWINMKKCKTQRVFFTACKDECLKVFPNTQIFGSVMTYKGAAGSNTSTPMPGIVI